ncbi:MAG TPA: DUF1566 domain-containing protein [bacterium]|nr:DUF1566 domain-containing protein [bacterium]
MTKYLMILAALFALVACGEDDGNDPVDNEAINDKAQPDADTTPVWVTDQTHAGLEWSPLSENRMKWQEAMDYCEAMGARLPNINELRKIIINCPGSTYGGACQVSDPDCLNSDCRTYEDCRCDASADSYSALGDGQIWLWSSSSRVNSANDAWNVHFYYGGVYNANKDGNYRARCVR